MLLRGFTLSELLVALAVLGIISAFIIPKILGANQQAVIKANLKEAMASFNEVTFQGIQVGSIRSGYNASYILNNLNATKLCSTQANSEGCYTLTPEGAVSTEQNEKGLQLASGAVIVGLSDTTGDESFWIDGNGSNGPNTIGIDVIYLSVCYDTGCSFASDAGAAIPGKVSYRQHSSGYLNNGFRDANRNLYFSLF
jgi:prepilin-type N-terminal cleavage/methylation domain-containing protein